MTLLAAPPRAARTDPSGVSPWLLAAGTVASIGGPLALVALYLPEPVHDMGRAAPLVVLLGVAAFAGPLVVWRRYSRHVAGPGGLSAFTTAAVGRPAGLVQAGVWGVSYLLYLLYTGDYVVRDVLPAAIPAAAGVQPFLEFALPAVVVAVVLAPLRVALGILGVVAMAQIAIGADLLALGSGPAASSAAGAAGLARGGTGVSLFFVCGSLPIFLGGEVRGGGRTVARSLAIGAAVVGVLVVATALAPLPDAGGFAAARSAGGAGFEAVVGIGAAASVLSLMAVEYMALARVAHATTGRSVRSLSRLLVLPLGAAAAVSVAHPFYGTLLRPSLIALWIAQIIPVAVYPRFAARIRRLTFTDWAASAVGVGLFGYGLYTAIAGAAAT